MLKVCESVKCCNGLIFKEYSVYVRYHHILKLWKTPCTKNKIIGCIKESQ